MSHLKGIKAFLTVNKDLFYFIYNQTYAIDNTDNTTLRQACPRGLEYSEARSYFVPSGKTPIKLR